MTIYKAQSQILNVTDLDNHSMFLHGKLYVAVSRVTRKQNLFMFAPESEMFNMVYPEIFNA